MYQIYKNKFDNDKNENIQENMDRLQTLLKKYFQYFFKNLKIKNRRFFIFTLKYELFNKNNKSYYVSLGLLSYNNREIVEDTWNKIKDN